MQDVFIVKQANTTDLDNIISNVSQYYEL